MERSFLLNNCLLSKHYNTKTRFAVYVVEILYENISLTEMLSSLKVAKKYMHVYYLHGKHFTCWDLRGMLESDNFGRIVNRLYYHSFKLCLMFQVDANSFQIYIRTTVKMN